MFSHYLHAFASDDKLHLVAALIALDIVLGVVAAVVTKTFSLQRIADFLRDDVLRLVVPWGALYFLGKSSSSNVAGVDFTTLADGAWVAVLATLLASLYGSLSQLGLPVPPLGQSAPEKPSPKAKK